MTGSGTLLDPYVIGDVNDLQAMGNDLAGYYILNNDIDAAVTVGWNGGLGFVPIGVFATPFTGDFDGKGYYIADLTINRPLEQYVGLFGYVNGPGEFKNVSLINAVISGYSFCGSLIGYHETPGGPVSNCNSTGSVSAVRGATGGLLGYANNSVTNCYSDCAVTVVNTLNTGGFQDDAVEVGGLIGTTLPGVAGQSVTNCYSTGAVSVTSLHRKVSSVGGLIGYSGGVVSQCYSTSTLTINANTTATEIGGFIGFCSWQVANVKVSDCYERGSLTIVAGVASYGDIGCFIGALDSGGGMLGVENCYAKGLLTYDPLKILTTGGFLADNYGPKPVTNCFWDTQSTGQAASPGGGTGKTTVEMQTLATYTNAGWDFVLIWGIHPNNYPVFGPAPLIVAPSVQTNPATEVI